jgi:hypothetical protein
MSKPVLFYGKSSQIDSVITYVEVQFRVSNTTDAGTKAATLASLFRGTALDWLSSTLKTHPEILDDYEGFVERVREDFALNEHAQKSQAARALTSLRQNRDVQTYASKFKKLAEEAGLEGATATALFIKGLKPKIRDALITSDERDTLNDAVSEATRLDTEFYYAGSRQSGGKHTKSGYQPRDHKGKFKKDYSPIKSEY